MDLTTTSPSLFVTGLSEYKLAVNSRLNQNGFKVRPVIRATWFYASFHAHTTLCPYQRVVLVILRCFKLFELVAEEVKGRSLPRLF